MLCERTIKKIQKRLILANSLEILENACIFKRREIGFAKTTWIASTYVCRTIQSTKNFKWDFPFHWASVSCAGAVLLFTISEIRLPVNCFTSAIVRWKICYLSSKKLLNIFCHDQANFLICKTSSPASFII